MPEQISRFRQSAQRHGIPKTLFRFVYRATQRLVTFSICRVEHSSLDPMNWPDVAGYETRAVDCNEFHTHLCDELKGTDFHWAFERGDICVASFYNQEIVGYSFSSYQPDLIRNELSFVYPRGFRYMFAARTSPSHRGNKLERDRWKVTRQAHKELNNAINPAIWYVDISNLESLATGKSAPIRSYLIGYAGYIRLFGKYFCFSSPGCRKLSTGFMPLRSK